MDFAVLLLVSSQFFYRSLNQLSEVENLHAQTAQLCLYKWRLLPSVFSGCNAHTSLLHHFHRLIDLKESGQIMVETRYGQKSHSSLIKPSHECFNEMQMLPSFCLPPPHNVSICH